MTAYPEDILRAAEEVAAEGAWNGVAEKSWTYIIAAALAAERDRSLREGYKLGFMNSGEGYNGEYPFEFKSYDEDPYFRQRMDETVAAAILGEKP
jgi:hypothetical protein